MYCWICKKAFHLLPRCNCCNRQIYFNVKLIVTRVVPLWLLTTSFSSTQVILAWSVFGFKEILLSIELRVSSCFTAKKPGPNFINRLQYSIYKLLNTSVFQRYLLSLVKPFQCLLDFFATFSPILALISECFLQYGAARIFLSPYATARIQTLVSRVAPTRDLLKDSTDWATALRQCLLVKVLCI